MRILILDDMEVRHQGFRIILAGHQLVHALTFSAAQKALAAGGFGMACLDHDLDDENPLADWYHDDYGRKKFFTGGHLAWWLRCQPHLCPARVVIHSHNPTGAAGMRENLQNIPGIELLVRPYSAPIVGQKP